MHEPNKRKQNKDNDERYGLRRGPSRASGPNLDYRLPGRLLPSAGGEARDLSLESFYIVEISNPLSVSRRRCVSRGRGVVGVVVVEVRDCDPARTNQFPRHRREKCIWRSTKMKIDQRNHELVCRVAVRNPGVTGPDRGCLLPHYNLTMQ